MSEQSTPVCVEPTKEAPFVPLSEVMPYLPVSPSLASMVLIEVFSALSCASWLFMIVSRSSAVCVNAISETRCQHSSALPYIYAATAKGEFRRSVTRVIVINSKTANLVSAPLCRAASSWWISCLRGNPWHMCSPGVHSLHTAPCAGRCQRTRSRRVRGGGAVVSGRVH